MKETSMFMSVEADSEKIEAASGAVEAASVSTDAASVRGEAGGDVPRVRPGVACGCESRAAGSRLRLFPARGCVGRTSVFVSR